MKKICLVLSICLLLSLCGCAAAPAETQKDPGDSDNGGAVQKGTALSEEALADWSKKLEADSFIWNMFLNHTYASVQELNLQQLFYDGTGEREVIDPQELKQVYTARPEFENLDIVKVTAAECNGVLQRYAGVQLSSLSQTALADFLYLSEHEAYYLGHSDTRQGAQYTLLVGWTRDDGSVLLEYSADNESRTGEVVLTQTAAGYQFRANTISG